MFSKQFFLSESDEWQVGWNLFWMITSEFRSRKTFTKRKKCKFTAKLEIYQEAWDGDFPTYLFLWAVRPILME